MLELSRSILKFRHFRVITRNCHNHLSADGYVEYRKDQLKCLKEWYPSKFHVSHQVSDILQKFKSIDKGENVENESLTLAGRIHTIRQASKKLSFIDLISNDDKIQVKVSFQNYQGDLKNEVDILRRGDVIGISGFPGRTKSGELSINAQSIKVLAPCLRKMANNHVKLDNIDKRFRNRHIDFLVNPDARETLKTRSRIIKMTRNFMENENFLEVETPILCDESGGAIAKPFETFHNEMGIGMKLRIAPELFLKKLVIGGFDRVFEIGKQFRNEGINPTHNPEFTTIEFYLAHADYFDVMSLTGRLLRDIVSELFGPEMKVPFTTKNRPILLDFKSKCNKLSYFSAIESVLDQTLPSPEEIHQNSEDTIQRLVKICKSADIDISSAKSSSAKLLDKLFSHFVEPELIQPTFVLDYPQVLSPLAKPHRSKPFIAERFEFFVAGKELANAYSELNNPILQKELFLRNNPENVDEHFVKALEYGLPPTAGFGMGLDRLVMILTNQPTIKEVIAFPTMRPEQELVQW